MNKFLVKIEWAGGTELTALKAENAGEAIFKVYNWMFSGTDKPQRITMTVSPVSMPELD